MNPQAILNMLLSNNPALKNNPIVNNALNMANQNNAQGLKSIAENLCKSKGIDINQAISQIQQMMK